MKVFISFFLTTLFFSNLFAQKQEPLREDWLSEDIENLKLISTLLPIENQSLEKLAQTLEQKVFANNQEIKLIDASDNYGFGYKHFNYRKGGGYCYLAVEGFVFENKYAYYNFGVDCSSDKWKYIRSKIIDGWLKNGGTKFEETKDGIFIERKFDEVFQGYKNAVNKKLGEMKSVNIPTNLSEYYNYLTSPMINSVVGSGGCDYAGITPQGKEAIDLFVKAKRIDLLENILRGYNPGGRVYALIALTKLKNKGKKLSAETLETMDKVLNLDIEIEICRGCVHYYHNTKEVLVKNLSEN